MDNLFFRLFPQVPLLVWMPALIAGIICSITITVLLKKNKKKWIVLTWIIAYLYIILYGTILNRECGDTYKINLIPFWSYDNIHNGFIETFYEKLYNIIVFIPYGFLLGLYFRNNRFKWVLSIGLLTSVCIELIQLVTKTGMCETDDVICNTLGCIIGVIVESVFYCTFVNI